MSRRVMPERFTEEDLSALESASKIVASRYRGYVDYSDLTQECFLWLIENYSKVLAWREEYGEKHASRTLIKALRHACERYARKEKAQVDGYEPADEFFYSIPVVANMLRLYFDPERFTLPAQDLSPRVSGGAPAQEGGNLMAMVADVGRSYEALPPHDKRLLAFVYSTGDPQENLSLLATEWECSPDAARLRVGRVVGRLRERLGGASPYGGEK
jgi:hypothetical protein